MSNLILSSNKIIRLQFSVYIPTHSQQNYDLSRQKEKFASSCLIKDCEEMSGFKQLLCLFSNKEKSPPRIDQITKLEGDSTLQKLELLFKTRQ